MGEEYGMFPWRKASDNIKPLQADEYGEITKPTILYLLT